MKLFRKVYAAILMLGAALAGGVVFGGTEAVAQERTSAEDLVKSLNASLGKKKTNTEYMPPQKLAVDTVERGRLRTPRRKERIQLVHTAADDPELFLLGGRTGVNIGNLQGRPNTLPEIRINGSLDKMPLVLIDGMESDLSRLNFKDIQKFEILSEPIDIAQYGYKGVNGVLRITTKDGSLARQRTGGIPFSITYTGSANLYTRTVYPQISYDLQEWADNKKRFTGSESFAMNLSTLFSEALIQNRLKEGSRGTDWESLLFNSSFFGTEHALSVSGQHGQGGGYELSGSFSAQGGIYTGKESHQHGTLHAGITLIPLRWWHIRNVLEYSHMSDITPQMYQPDISEGYYHVLAQFGYPYAALQDENGYTDEAVFTQTASMQEGICFNNTSSVHLVENLSNSFSILADPSGNRLAFNLGLSAEWHQEKSSETLSKKYSESAADHHDTAYSSDIYRGDANLSYSRNFHNGLSVYGRLGFEAYHYRQDYTETGPDMLHTYRQKFMEYRQYFTLDMDWKGRYALSFAQSHDRHAPMKNTSASYLENSNTAAGKVSWTLSREPFMKSLSGWLSLARLSFNAGKTTMEEMAGTYGPNMSWKAEAGFFGNRLEMNARIFRNRYILKEEYLTRQDQSLVYVSIPSLHKVKGWDASISWKDHVKAGKRDLAYAVYGSIWDSSTRKSPEDESVEIEEFLQDGDIYGWTDKESGIREVIGNSTPRYMFNFGVTLKYAGMSFNALFAGTGKRDWSPDSAYDVLFYGMYSEKGADLVLEKFRDADIATSGNQDAYWPEFRSGSISHGIESRYLQNAAFIRLKNLEISYTFETETLRKTHFESIEIFCKGRNLFHFTPMHRHAPDIDPEMIYPGTTRGAGDAYPLLRTVEIGLSLRF